MRKKEKRCSRKKRDIRTPCRINERGKAIRGENFATGERTLLARNFNSL